MNQKNSLGLNECFLNTDNPIELFKIWMEKAKKHEIKDPNALSLATSDKDGNSSVRMVLLKNVSEMNPFFYIIDGFRCGFLGVADGSIQFGLF